MKKNKYELYTLNCTNEFGDTRVSDVFFVVLHGFDTDARGHKFTPYIPYGKPENDDTPDTDIHIDHENPFVLVPIEYADLLGQYTDTVAVVSPLYGDTTNVTTEEIAKALSRIKSMFTMFDTIHMLPSFGSRLSLVPTKKPKFSDIPKACVKKDPKGVFGYMYPNTDRKYQKRIINITVDGEDTALNIETKELKESVEDIHAQYLRPIETAIGTCYECDAIMLKYIAGVTSTLRGFMDPELIEKHGFQIYKDALNLYPDLWSILKDTHEDIIRENIDVIYERPTSLDLIDRSRAVDDLRCIVKNTMNYCLDTSTDIVEARRTLSNMIDDIDEDDLYALATDAYKKSSKEITNKLLKSYDGKLINLEDFEKGLSSRVEAYQKHEYDPYYDD